MICRVLSFAVALLALSAFTATPAFSKDEADKDTHEGWVVKTGEHKLTMMGKDKKEHSHDIGEKTEITLDGKKAKLEDLKEKMHIFVTIKDKHVTMVEAHTKDKTEKDKDK